MNARYAVIFRLQQRRKSAEKASDLEQITWGAEIPEEFQNEVLKDYMKILASGGIA